MRRRNVLLILVPVAALSFCFGWFGGPGLRVAGLPEAGRLRPVARGCNRVGASLGELRVFSEEAVRYSPGDSSAVEAVSFRRRGTSAELLLVRSGMEDDEVEAEAKQYDLQWKPESGWVVVDCRSAVRKDGLGSTSPCCGSRYVTYNQE